MKGSGGGERERDAPGECSKSPTSSRSFWWEEYQLSVSVRRVQIVHVFSHFQFYFHITCVLSLVQVPRCPSTRISVWDHLDHLGLCPRSPHPNGLCPRSPHPDGLCPRSPHPDGLCPRSPHPNGLCPLSLSCSAGTFCLSHSPLMYPLMICFLSPLYNLKN